MQSVNVAVGPSGIGRGNRRTRRATTTPLAATKRSSRTSVAFAFIYCIVTICCIEAITGDELRRARERVANGPNVRETGARLEIGKTTLYAALRAAGEADARHAVQSTFENDGMAIARAKGKLRGKKPELSDRQQKELHRMHDGGDCSISDLAEPFAVSRPTVYRTLHRQAGRATANSA